MIKKRRQITWKGDEGRYKEKGGAIGMQGAAVSLCCETDGAGFIGDGGVGSEAGEGAVGVEEISTRGGDTGGAGGAGRSVEERPVLFLVALVVILLLE
jgi:hypothetical protein